MQFPRLNLNGTSGKTLLEEHLAALEAVKAAIVAVQAITCHGRDYYVISSNAASDAYRERLERLLKLDSVEKELETLALNISEQMEQHATS